MSQDNPTADASLFLLVCGKCATVFLSADAHYLAEQRTWLCPRCKSPRSVRRILSRACQPALRFLFGRRWRRVERDIAQQLDSHQKTPCSLCGVLLPATGGESSLCAKCESESRNRRCALAGGATESDCRIRGRQRGEKQTGDLGG